MKKYLLVLALILSLTVPFALPRATAQDFSAFDFIVGPQVPITNSWFDQTEIDKARVHGAQCTANPPTDDAGFNSYVLLHYYDLAQTQYIAWKRTGDPIFLQYARNCADEWWKNPHWIGEGKIRLFPDSQTPAPRHGGIGGLILRAIDGRPEMWDWITAYTRATFDNWVKRRVNDSKLYYGVREGAFVLHYAIWLAAAHPDPNVRAQFLADAELVSVNYFGRLQYPDGSWRWDTTPDEPRDGDGGILQGVTQPFQVGLLLNALIDVHRLSSNETVRANVANQIVKGSRHLYFDGPYRTSEIPGLPGKRWRDFWYLYHGGTSVNPTKYENGGSSYTDLNWNADCGTNAACTVGIGRQAISTIFNAFQYAYLLTGDLELKAAGEDLVDSAFVGSDGFRGFANDTAKNYNQTYRMGARYFWWITQLPGSQPTPTPSPNPSPTPVPTPSPSPSPTVTPTPLPTDTIPPTATVVSPLSGAVLSGSVTVFASAADNVGVDAVYLVLDGSVVGADGSAPYSFSLNTTQLSDGSHSLYVRAWDRSGNAGDSERVNFIVANAAPSPTATPTPIPSPSPSPTATPTPTPVPSPSPTPTPEPSPSPSPAPTPRCIKFHPKTKQCQKWI